MAQRMESVAPPGGVMLSESTARWSRRGGAGRPEMVQHQGRRRRCRARRLVAIASHTAPVRSRRSDTGWAATGNQRHCRMLDRGHRWARRRRRRGGARGHRQEPSGARSRRDRGCARCRRVLRPSANPSPARSHCTSCAAVARGHRDRRAGSTRPHARSYAADFPAPTPRTCVLLDDLLGIARPWHCAARYRPGRAPPATDGTGERRLAGARGHRRSTSSKTSQWIDEVSESMLADFLAVIPQTPAMVLITYRPEYPGGLTQAAGAQTIALAPLNDPKARR